MLRKIYNDFIYKILYKQKTERKEEKERKQGVWTENFGWKKLFLVIVCGFFMKNFLIIHCYCWNFLSLVGCWWKWIYLYIKESWNIAMMENFYLILFYCWTKTTYSMYQLFVYELIMVIGTLIFTFYLYFSFQSFKLCYHTTLCKIRKHPFFNSKNVA